jgi:hypothetical protein
MFNAFTPPTTDRCPHRSPHRSPQPPPIADALTEAPTGPRTAAPTDADRCPHARTPAPPIERCPHRSPQRCPPPTPPRTHPRVKPNEAPPHRIDTTTHRSLQPPPQLLRAHRPLQPPAQLLFGRFRLIIWPFFSKPTPAALALPRSQFFAPVAVACCQPDLMGICDNKPALPQRMGLLGLLGSPNNTSL